MILSPYEAHTLLDLIDRLNLTLSTKEAEVYSRLSLFVFQHRQDQPRANPIEDHFLRECEKDIEEDERGDFR